MWEESFALTYFDDSAQQGKIWSVAPEGGTGTCGMRLRKIYKNVTWRCDGVVILDKRLSGGQTYKLDTQDKMT